jgi:hypothetical protein
MAIGSHLPSEPLIRLAVRLATRSTEFQHHFSPSQDFRDWYVAETTDIERSLAGERFDRSDGIGRPYFSIIYGLRLQLEGTELSTWKGLALW